MKIFKYFNIKNSFKIALCLFAYLTLCLLRVSTTHALTISKPIEPTPANYNNPNLAPEVKPGLHAYSQSVIIETASAFVCMLGGVDPIAKDHKCLTVTQDGKIGYAKDNQNMGINRFFANSLVMLYQNMPAHTSDYIAYLGNNFNPMGVKHAYAAYSGFDKLFPIQDIWVVIRNFAYLLMVIAFMFVGTAIMFRVKIDPRTVMTIENQLPKLIIGLVAITFSFVIAGIMIDLMNILINLMYNVFVGIPNIDIAKLNPDTMLTSTPWDAVNAMIPNKIQQTQIVGTASIQLPIPKGLKGLWEGLYAVTQQPMPTNLPGWLSFVWGHVNPFDIMAQFLTPILTVLLATTQNTIASTVVPLGFGSGIQGIATNAALSFGSVLERYLKLDTFPVIPTDGLNSILGPLFPTFFFENIKNGSPVGFVLDIASWFLSLSATNFVVGFARGGVNALGFGGEILGNVVGASLYGRFLGVFFSFIDTSIRQWGPYILIWLVIYIAIFLAMSRLFFGLVFTWAQILFQIILGPLVILLGFIPGIEEMGLVGYLKALGANILAFPVTAGIFFLGSAILQEFNTAGCAGLAAGNFKNANDAANAINNAKCFIPILVGGGAIPVSILTAITTLFAASNGPQIAKDLLKFKDNKNFNAFQTTSGAALQSTYKAGKATIYGFGKTPSPGSRGGALAAFGQV